MSPNRTKKPDSLGGCSTREAIKAIKAFGRAAAKMPIFALEDVAKIRIQRIKAESGPLRFLKKEYYQWQIVKNKALFKRKIKL